jgi:hypothetical protein
VEVITNVVVHPVTPQRVDFGNLHTKMSSTSINKNTLHRIPHLKTGINIGCNCVDGIVRKQVEVSGLVAFRIFRDWNFNTIINEDGS